MKAKSVVAILFCLVQFSRSITPIHTAVVQHPCPSHRLSHLLAEASGSSLTRSHDSIMGESRRLMSLTGSGGTGHRPSCIHPDPPHHHSQILVQPPRSVKLSVNLHIGLHRQPGRRREGARASSSRPARRSSTSALPEASNLANETVADVTTRYELC